MPSPDDSIELEDADYVSPVSEQYDAALKQLGTLGGGNHFIEIQKGDDGFIWFMVHSGSRNIGLKVANHHNKIAINKNQKWFSTVPKNWQLAFLPWNSLEGQRYIVDMNFCLEFALANRRLMADRVAMSICNHTSCTFGKEINIHHNYANFENHFKTNVVVHRKGATSARKGQLGIIPGSQGTHSYIVKGKGNPDSFTSCSHGAGRLMSRTKARKTLDLQNEINSLERKGIVHSIRTEKDLDEAASAYKPIDVVMAEQEDLVDVVVVLQPLGVIKG